MTLSSHVLPTFYAALYVMQYNDIFKVYVNYLFWFPDQKNVLILKTFNDVHKSITGNLSLACEEMFSKLEDISVLEFKLHLYSGNNTQKL